MLQSVNVFKVMLRIWIYVNFKINNGHKNELDIIMKNFLSWTMKIKLKTDDYL